MAAIEQKQMVSGAGGFVGPIVALLGALLAIAIAVPAAILTIG